MHQTVYKHAFFFSKLRSKLADRAFERALLRVLQADVVPEVRGELRAPEHRAAGVPRVLVLGHAQGPVHAVQRLAIPTNQSIEIPVAFLPDLDIVIQATFWQATSLLHRQAIFWPDEQTNA